MLDKNISLAWPKISVVTPSFNQGKYIEQTILSVIEQHYPNIEYIVIDGGSNDETNHILAKYADTIDYCVSEPDKGQSHAINKGFAVATGDIFCWLNSDDQFAPDALKSVALAYLEKKADVIAGICEVYQDDKLVHRHFTSCQDGPLPLNEILDLDNGWNAGQFFYQPEVFFTRELWQKAGGAVNEDCFYSMDYELWCRFALHQANLVGIGVPLVHFRMHSEQKTADEAAFKSELINVRDRFLLEHNINWTQSERPPVNWSRKLKVAFINDLGYKFGAGTAQLRIAGAFDLAGQDCSVFDLLTYQQADGSYRCLFGKVAEFDPDVVIFGNLHAITPNDISVLKSIEQLYPTYWLTHDFWLLTGRCPYPSNCTKYITGCDSDCPTKDAYPVIASDDIARSWQSKHEFLSATNQLTILANSEWSKSFIDNALPKNTSAPTDLIRLGAPVEIFKPQDKWEAKKQIGVEKNSFTIAFSVSSLSDLRKGGDLLLGALKLLSDMNITLLLIGRLDVDWEFPNVKCISLGYIDNVKQLVLALNAADLYVGPSREETFGQVFIEAALCGTPSLGFSASGVTDAIIDNVTGFKLESQTAEALAAAIESLYLSPDTCLRIAELAPIYARAFYSLEASYRTFFNVLDRQNVIDTCKAPHKISFSATSDLIANCTKGWVALSWFDNLNWKLRGVTTRLIGCFSPEFTSKVRQSLPKWLEKRVMIWLLGK
ncbi:glycosyltransferase [Shewanella algidipiscicola]|uniref:glycosyltransferase n=3 Tax=Shewanella algidipiscicola TaxID=614070 RepID=UPI000E747CDD|nr:glycosyltransferase [Shewanella algidipiscicola]